MQVYFDNASTTPLLPEVKEAMIAVIDQHYGNPSSIHKKGREAKIIVEDARRIIAQGLKASTGEIFFTSGATEANNMSILCSIRDHSVRHIISSNIEHHCILHTLDYVRENGLAKVTIIDVLSDGSLDYEKLKSTLSESEVKTMICFMHVNNEIGVINDINKLSLIAEEHKALFLCDTAQSIGKLPIDLSTTRVSFVCGVAHKFFGPKGVGFIYVNNDNMIKPLIHGGSQERGMRSGTENIYGIAGMAKAYQLAMDNMADRKTKIEEVKSYFQARIQAELDDIIINGGEPALYNILSVSFPSTDKSDMMMMNLDIAGIAASAGSACSSGVENESHVLQAIGHDPKRKTVRFSFSHLNTKEEVDYVIEQLKKITPTKNDG